MDHPGDDPYFSVGYIFLRLQKNLLGLRCIVDDLTPWLKVGPGCTIKLKGVAEVGLICELHNCVIVESSPNTCMEITAVKLANVFATDKKAAVDKYHEKWLIVEGELASKEPSKADEGRFMILTLKGDRAVSVSCGVANHCNDQQRANDDLKVGQKVKVCGVADIDVNEKGPVISSRGGRMVTLVR